MTVAGKIKKHQLREQAIEKLRPSAASPSA